MLQGTASREDAMLDKPSSGKGQPIQPGHPLAATFSKEEYREGVAPSGPKQLCSDPVPLPHKVSSAGNKAAAVFSRLSQALSLQPR